MDSFTISDVLIESWHALKYLLFAGHNDILNAVDDDRAPDHGVLVEPQLVHVLVGGEQVVHVLVVQLEEGHLGGEWWLTWFDEIYYFETFTTDSAPSICPSLFNLSNIWPSALIADNYISDNTMSTFDIEAHLGTIPALGSASQATFLFLVASLPSMVNVLPVPVWP